MTSPTHVRRHHTHLSTLLRLLVTRFAGTPYTTITAVSSRDNTQKASQRTTACNPRTLWSIGPNNKKTRQLSSEFAARNSCYRETQNAPPQQCKRPRAPRLILLLSREGVAHLCALTRLHTSSRSNFSIKLGNGPFSHGSTFFLYKEQKQS